MMNVKRNTSILDILHSESLLSEIILKESFPVKRLDSFFSSLSLQQLHYYEQKYSLFRTGRFRTADFLNWPLTSQTGGKKQRLRFFLQGILYLGSSSEHAYLHTWQLQFPAGSCRSLPGIERENRTSGIAKTPQTQHPEWCEQAQNTKGFWIDLSGIAGCGSLARSLPVRSMISRRKTWWKLSASTSRATSFLRS